jgi:hypothetical protein
MRRGPGVAARASGVLGTVVRLYPPSAMGTELWERQPALAKSLPGDNVASQSQYSPLSPTYTLMGRALVLAMPFPSPFSLAMIVLLVFVSGLPRSAAFPFAARMRIRRSCTDV